MTSQGKCGAEALLATEMRARKAEAANNDTSRPYIFSSAEVLHALDNNESGDASLLKKAMRGLFCFDIRRKLFYRFEDGYWKKDLEEEYLERARGILQAAYLQEEKRQSVLAFKDNSPEEESSPELALKAKAARDRAKSLLMALKQRRSQANTLRRLRNIMVLAATGINGLNVPGTNWNADPWLLQAKDRVIDLRSGRDRPGRPLDYINKVAPTPWRGLSAMCPVWEQFISSVFRDDEKLALYMQKVLGAALLGMPSQQEFYILHGAGRNGKSTLFETVMEVLGEELASPIKTSLIMEDRRFSGSADPELLSLQGKRIVWACESGNRKKLDTEQVKLFTGGDTLSGRYNYSNEIITFPPTHTLFLLTNHMPHIQEADTAIWDRLRAIPFNVRFVDNPDPNAGERQKDPYLKEKLLRESSGILAWLVLGCLLWQKEGLNPPEVVLDYSNQYRLDEDCIQNFIQEKCLLGAQYRVQASVLYEAFSSWHKDCFGETSRIMSQRRFMADITSKPGITKEKRHFTYCYGLGLASDGGA